MAVLEESCQDRINFHKLVTTIFILITAVYVSSFLYFGYLLGVENSCIEVMKVLSLIWTVMSLKRRTGTKQLLLKSGDRVGARAGRQWGWRGGCSHPVLETFTIRRAKRWWIGQKYSGLKALYGILGQSCRLFSKHFCAILRRNQRC